MRLVVFSSPKDARVAGGTSVAREAAGDHATPSVAEGFFR